MSDEKSLGAVAERSEQMFNLFRKRVECREERLKRESKQQPGFGENNDREVKMMPWMSRIRPREEDGTRVIRRKCKCAENVDELRLVGVQRLI